MSRMTLFHRTTADALPLIEVDGLLTRVELSDRLGPVDAFDEAATGRFARGRRVSGWVTRPSGDDPRAQGLPGVVSFTVDPRRAVANRAARREADPAGVWAAMRPLAAWLEDVGGEVDALPDDLEVHQELPVRAKLMRIHAPDVSDDALGLHAALVAALADDDRVAAKLLMHLALVLADGDPASSAYLAACALAWRDEEDDRDLGRRIARADVETVLEAVLAEQEDAAPEGVRLLRVAFDGLVEEAGGADGDLGTIMMDRSERSLARIVRG